MQIQSFSTAVPIAARDDGLKTATDGLQNCRCERWVDDDEAFFCAFDGAISACDAENLGNKWAKNRAPKNYFQKIFVVIDPPFNALANMRESSRAFANVRESSRGFAQGYFELFFGLLEAWSLQPDRVLNFCAGRQRCHCRGFS